MEIKNYCSGCGVIMDQPLICDCDVELCSVCRDRSNAEQPRHICTVNSPASPRLNGSHPVIQRLADVERQKLLSSFQQMFGVFGIDGISWQDDVPQGERDLWSCAIEWMLNNAAWGHVEYRYSHSLQSRIEDTLEVAGIRRSALQCLDEDDTERLEKALIDAAVSAYRSEKTSLKRFKTDWSSGYRTGRSPVRTALLSWSD